MNGDRVLKRLARGVWRAIRTNLRRDRYAFRDLGRTLAYWAGDRPPPAARITKRTRTTAGRVHVKAHVRSDGTRVKAHWRVR